MLRYVISFPGDITPYQLDEMRARLREVVDEKAWRDIVLASGGTITDMRRPDPALTARRRAVGARVR